MTDEPQVRAAALRAMRAWANLQQGEAAASAGISENSLIAAEKGRRCSDKTWRAMTDFYASRGLVLRAGDPLLLQITAEPRAEPD